LIHNLIEQSISANPSVDNTNYYLVFSTVVLVGVTIYYAIQTKRSAEATKSTVDVMKESTKAQFLPYVKASLISIGPMAVALDIINAGKGPAKELTVEFALGDKKVQTNKWTQPLLVSGDFRRFPIPTDSGTEINIDHFKKNKTILHIESKYNDIFDQKHSNNETIDVTGYVNQFGTTISFYLEAPMDKLARSTDTIAHAADKMARRS
jgi:heme/copper-type cytochrome/quinol oxidase subunit 2